MKVPTTYSGTANVLPLHVAMQCQFGRASPSIILKLLDLYPEAVHTPPTRIHGISGTPTTLQIALGLAVGPIGLEIVQRVMELDPASVGMSWEPSATQLPNHLFCALERRASRATVSALLALGQAPAGSLMDGMPNTGSPRRMAERRS